MAATEPESAAPLEPGASRGEAAGGAAGSSAEAVRLLVKGLGMLPATERDQVYTWLLGRGIAGSFGTGPLSGRVREVSSQLLSLQRIGGLPGSQQSGSAQSGSAQIAQQVVPVRFGADQHAALRSWCAEHGFSMATVIRGLVARFLDGQLPGRN
jgi:hypothetical protein